jgi:hypothetical protein
VRKRLTKLIVFLLLGAIVNVAVAWGLALRAQEYPLSSHRVASWTTWYSSGVIHYGIQCQRGDVMSREKYQSDLKFSLANNLDHGFVEHLLLPESSEAARVRSIRIRSSDPLVIDVHCGWPMRSIRCEIHYSSTASVNGNVIDPGKVRMAYVSAVQAGMPVVFPLLPLWPGFAVNTIFYGAILWGVWMLFVVPGVVKRHRRRKRGLCPACAYPVGASQVCTECGKPLAALEAR